MITRDAREPQKHNKVDPFVAESYPPVIIGTIVNVTRQPLEQGGWRGWRGCG